MKTGSTDQVKYDKRTSVKNVIYRPGVYHSFNLNGALPMRKEYIVECKRRRIVANDLNEALLVWTEDTTDEVLWIQTLG